VFGLIRWIFSLLIFAILIWFATMVPLGSKTLWQHVKAIAGTKEAKDLADGTKHEAKKVAERVRGEGKATDAGVGAPLDPVDKNDRDGLDRLVRDKTARKK